MWKPCINLNGDPDLVKNNIFQFYCENTLLFFIFIFSSVYLKVLNGVWIARISLTVTEILRSFRKFIFFLLTTFKFRVESSRLLQNQGKHGKKARNYLKLPKISVIVHLLPHKETSSPGSLSFCITLSEVTSVGRGICTAAVHQLAKDLVGNLSVFFISYLVSENKNKIETREQRIRKLNVFTKCELIVPIRIGRIGGLNHRTSSI